MDRPPRIQIAILLMALAAFLIWGIFTGKLAVNLGGIEAVKACQDGEIDDATKSIPAVFGTGLYRCLDDQTRLDQSALQIIETEPERILFLRVMFPEKLELAQYAVERNPKDAEAWFWLGDVYHNRGENDQAIRAYETGLDFRPVEANIWDIVGRYYEEQGDWQMSARAFDMACIHIDQGKNGCPRAGNLYLTHGEYEKAARSYRISLYQLWRWPTAVNGLRSAALGLLDQGKTEIALPYLRVLARAGDSEASEILREMENRP